MDSSGSYVYSGYGKPNTGAGIILGESTAAKDYVDTAKLEAKAAKAANKGLKVGDLNYPSGYLPEDDKVINDLANQYVNTKAAYLSSGVRDYKTEATLQKLKLEVERKAELSKQWNQDYVKAINEITADEFSYPQTALQEIDEEKAKPIEERRKIQANKLSEKHWADEIAKGATEYYYTKTKGSYGSKGGGKTETEVVYDPTRAEAAWNEVSDLDRKSRWFNVLYRVSTEDARKDYEKSNPGMSFDNLDKDSQISLVDNKAKNRYLKILEDRVPKDQSEISKANREGKGGGKKTKEVGEASYYATSNLDAAGNLTITEMWQLPKPSTGSDTRLSKNVFFDGSGKPMDKFVEPTGTIRRVEGKGQAEIAVNIYEDMLGQKLNTTTWIPLNEQNKKVLNSKGYKKLSDISDEARRKSNVEGVEPMSPADWAETLNTDGSKRTQDQIDDYTSRYNLWKSKGAKRNTYKGNRNQLTEVKKAGTFDPTSGTINWA